MLRFNLLLIIFITATLASVTANAVDSGVAHVTELMQWNEADPVFFKIQKTSDQSTLWCYVDGTEKRTYSLILSMFVSGKGANFTYDSSAFTYNGLTGYKLQRVNAGINY